MKIEFVNHASVIIEYCGVRMIFDPWIEGRVFNNGWDLITPTKFPYENFKSITHIWFSHEHPDHFFPPNIKNIPKEYRQKIVVLYQETIDKKVIGYCRKMGFKDVVELKPDTPLKLLHDLSIVCSPWRSGDSYLYLKAGKESLLNTNDCVLLSEDEIKSVAERVGKVDVLLTQFSLSSWEGNPEEIERRKAGAQTMLDRIVRQTNIFNAQYVIPFASYVWFCHDENYYINSEANRIDLVDDELRKKTKATPIVMYPNDGWVVGESFDSAPAIAKYVEDFDSLPSREKFKIAIVPEPVLKDEARSFIAKLVEKSGHLRMAVSFARLTYSKRKSKSTNLAMTIKNLIGLIFLEIEPSYIYLHDHQKSYAFDLNNGLVESNKSKEQCDIILGSDSLSYGFKNLFGGESLLVNGRFSEVYPDGRNTLFDYFFVANAQNRGVVMTWSSIPAKLLSFTRSR